MEQKIYEILKERFGIEDTINSDTDLVNQLGFESISLVELASVLSKETGVKVTHSLAIKWTTVKSILSTLAANSKDNNA
jgi:acyl carrier protein